jgi:ribosomal protein S18 acetylase RimI-like enzyme
MLKNTIIVVACIIAGYCAVSYFKTKQTKRINMVSIHVKTAGKFLAKDKAGAPVVLEWIETDILSPDYAAGMKSIADIASQAFAAVELQFLREHPEAVQQDEYLKQYLPFFENGPEAVDWKLVEGKIQSNLKQMHELDFSSYGPDVLKPFINDVYFFVVIKDHATEAPLGYINFSIAPGYAQGDIKVTGIGIKPSEQNRGLGKLLMSSIFNIAPQIKRIFLCTRITNENAFRAYRSWGFVPDLNPIEEPNFKMIREHWNYMEYKIENSDVLQKTAATFEKM